MQVVKEQKNLWAEADFAYLVANDKKRPLIG